MPLRDPVARSAYHKAYRLRMTEDQRERERAYRRAHRAANLTEMSAKDEAARRRKRAWLDSLKAAPCMGCGVSYPPYVMDFDHRPGEEKIASVAYMLGSRSREEIETEVAKCDLVCSNCHRERTHQREEKA